MAYSGQTIENPVSGERITFHETAADTDGERLTITLELSRVKLAERRGHGERYQPLRPAVA